MATDLSRFFNENHLAKRDCNEGGSNRRSLGTMLVLPFDKRHRGGDYHKSEEDNLNRMLTLPSNAEH